LVGSARCADRWFMVSMHVPKAFGERQLSMNLAARSGDPRRTAGLLSAPTPGRLFLLASRRPGFSLNGTGRRESKISDGLRLLANTPPMVARFS